MFHCAGMRRETMMVIIFEDKFLCGKPYMVENLSDVSTNQVAVHKNVKKSSPLIASSQCYGRS